MFCTTRPGDPNLKEREVLAHMVDQKMQRRHATSYLNSLVLLQLSWAGYQCPGRTSPNVHWSVLSGCVIPPTYERKHGKEQDKESNYQHSHRPLRPPRRFEAVSGHVAQTFHLMTMQVTSLHQRGTGHTS